MTTLVHRTLGEVLIREICEVCGLDEGDQKIVDQILIQWSTVDWDILKRKQIFSELTAGNPKRLDMAIVLNHITMEFAEKRLS